MYFFIRTQSPRPTFHLDMTPEERVVMQKHAGYWSEKAAQGIAIVFGPVMDPKGVYGIGVYHVKDEAEMRELLAHDFLLRCVKVFVTGRMNNSRVQKLQKALRFERHFSSANGFDRL